MLPRLALRPLAFLLLLLFLPTLPGCAMFRRPEPPQLELMELAVSDISLSHANMVARLRLYNPNNFSLKVFGMRFKLALNDVQMASGSNVGNLAVAPHQASDMQVRLSSPLWSFFTLANSLEKSREVRFALDGNVDIGGLGILGGSIPIHREGTIPLEGLTATYLQQLQSK